MPSNPTCLPDIRSFVATLIALSLAGIASAAEYGNVEVSTRDGMAIQLAPGVRVSLAGQTLPANGLPGGLMIRDMAIQPRPNLLHNSSFETGGTGWRCEGECAVDEKVFHDGKASMRLRSGAHLRAATLPASGGTDYVISFWAKGETAAHFDVAGHTWSDWKAVVRQTDETGHQTAPDYEFSPFAKDNLAPMIFGWTLMRNSFRTHPDTRRLEIGFVLGGAKGSLWVDNVWLSEAGSGPETPVGGWFVHSGRQVEQTAELKEMGLSVRARYRSEVKAETDAEKISDAEKIEVQAEITDTTGKDRAVQVGFRLPVDLTGWYWGDHLRASRKIEPRKEYYRWYELGAPGRWVNNLPFSAVTGEIRGLALGSPMDTPRVFRASYGPNGLEIWYDLGLSKETAHFPSQASVRLVIYTYPGKWGFRAATDKYHRLYPQFFVRHAKQVGMANLGYNWYDRLRNPEDFALRFSGGDGVWMARNRMYQVSYTQPWAWWMHWQAVKAGKQISKPSDQEVLARIRQRLAVDPNSTAGYTPVTVTFSEMARAYRNSASHDENGKIMIGMLNPWSTGIANLELVTNPDPALPLPNRGSISRDQEWAPPARTQETFGLPSLGQYFDGLGSTGDNYRREHWRTARQPLIFDPHTRKVCESLLFAAYDFVSERSSQLRRQGALVMNNGSHVCENINAHLSDFFQYEGSCDYTGNDDSDEVFNLLHTVLRTKPFSFYDYDWWRKSYGEKIKEHRLRKCLFYGTFPGLPWVDDPALCYESAEVLRPLCRKYTPAMERVAEAGWNPITGAVASDPAVMVERYGDGRKGNLNFTMRNETKEERTFNLMIDADEVGLAAHSGELAVMNTLSNNAVPFGRRGSQIELQVRLAADETRAFAIATAAQLAAYSLRMAAERLGRITDIAAFNTAAAPPAHSIDLRPGGYVDKTHSRGSYQIAEDPALLDSRGRPAIRMNNRREGDCGNYWGYGEYDIKVEPGKQYRLRVRYQARSPQKLGQEPRALSIRIGFHDYWATKATFLHLKSPPAAATGTWSLFEATFIAPPDASRAYVGFSLSGNDTTVWLGDLRLAKAEDAEAALAESEPAKSPDGWLAAYVQPTLVQLAQETSRLAEMTSLLRLQMLNQKLSVLKEEILRRYPRTDELRNREAWQRLDDAAGRMGEAKGILSR